MDALIFVGIGGFLGANARYLLSGWISRQLVENFGITFPYGTLIINFSGSLLLAMFVVWSAGRVQVSPNIRLLVATGFFGAYTTFSTFANETVALARGGNWVGAAANVMVTNILCGLGVLVGLAVASRFHS